MGIENGGVIRWPGAKVVAIPQAASAFGAAIAEQASLADSRLALGALPEQFSALDAKIDGRDGIHCQPVNLDKPKSAMKFFQIAFAQLGQLDVVVLEAVPHNKRRTTMEKQIEVGTRRLLHCLDAALLYAGRDLHFICITPAYGPAVIPIATAFLGAKASAARAMVIPRVRLSIVSPPVAFDDISFARTILHVMREPQSPDIMETVLSPRQRPRSLRSKRQMDGHGKISAPI